MITLGPHPDFPECMVVCDRSEEFCHTRPYPTDGQLSKYYESEYRMVRNESPDPDYVQFMDQRAKMQMNFITEASCNSNFKSALDIGCGAGRLLNLLGEQCGQVCGYEADKAMAEYALANRTGVHIRVINELFQPETARINAQLITMSHVLEHVPNPIEFLNLLGNRVLPSGGFLFIEVPYDPEHWVKKQLEWKIQGLAHINYFTKTSLQGFLIKSGYEVVSIRTCGQPLKKFIRTRKPKSFLARQIDKITAAILPETPRADIYKTLPDSKENIYLQAVAIFR